uniref:NADH-ubiquinone oxidoreductase chain 2 n=1 Tax=Brachionus rotundiformis TaxID=96890 RepID=A0A1C9J9W2_9BILA|nr:NADH dehydrogenase subunit 2 [Brachionus rotundiformis]
MFVLFTPYSFLFLSLYLMMSFSLFSINNFYYYWLVMELIMLLFMGLSYTLFVSSYSQLMVYFLIQALSSFLILLSYVYSFSLLLTVAVLMKLSMFPFYSWFINVVYSFPNFMVWLSSTLHKLPLMVMLSTFNLELNSTLVWVSITLTVLVSGILMLMLIDFRMMLIVSSVGNNSWFLLSQMNSFFIFLLFFLVYSLSLFGLFLSFKGVSKPSSSLSMAPSSYLLSFWVLSVSGMPPFPVFYVKMLVIYMYLINYSFNHYFFVFILFSSFMLMGYLQSIMKNYIYMYSSVSHILMKW